MDFCLAVAAVTMRCRGSSLPTDQTTCCWLFIERAKCQATLDHFLSKAFGRRRTHHRVAACFIDSFVAEKAITGQTTARRRRWRGTQCVS
ncbi:hypothetical protein PR003_g26147 [Phytophthora rubi]|uniref:Uncharacterized protein n=1 Tax=Phytophthora rubi TaxID=129364 RepID=A0A6A4CBZ0_9STRA|nr:hypothetical protein PR002_g25250 [Phytophthora rubi]KAE8978091.1 hypothetical protein PR001_g24941 [Phytophthora rubi]KAE9287056.1 hypothetical protein PR003_g26147 [Phytophthora rubi]